MADSISRMAKTSMPGIYKLPSGLFLVRIRMRFGAASLTFKSMSSAKRWQRATAVGLEDGTLAIHKGVVMSKEEMLRRTSQIVTVAQAIERFTQSGDCKVKPDILRLINKGLGELAVADVDKAAIVHFLDAYSEGKAPSTRNRYN